MDYWQGKCADVEFDQQCLDSLFVELQSRGLLVVFETVAVMDVVWIGGSAPKPCRVRRAKNRIDLDCAHEAQWYEEWKQNSFLRTSRLC
jgi:hypothetical protein